MNSPGNNTGKVMSATAAPQKDPANGQFLPGNYGPNGKLTLHDPAEITRKTNEYLCQCEQQEVSATIPGLAYALGFSNKSSLHSAVDNMAFRDDLKDTRDSVADALKRARLFIEAQRVQRMVDGKGNVVGAIFDLKNNFGYIDKQVNETDIKVAHTYTSEDREALKDLAMQMVEARELDDTLLIEESVSSSGDLAEVPEGEAQDPQYDCKV